MLPHTPVQPANGDIYLSINMLHKQDDSDGDDDNNKGIDNENDSGGVSGDNNDDGHDGSVDDGRASSLVFSNI